MRAVLPVLGLLRWHRQKLSDEREVKVQQEGSVKKEEVLATALGVAGEFAFADGQIPYDRAHSYRLVTLGLRG